MEIVDGCLVIPMKIVAWFGPLLVIGLPGLGFVVGMAHGAKITREAFIRARQKYGQPDLI